jgi:hypothetical protein
MVAAIRLTKITQSTKGDSDQQTVLYVAAAQNDVQLLTKKI